MSDPAAAFIAEVDASPAAERPPGWERIKALMARRAPAVGEAAPDFELATPDGSTRIRCSTFQGHRPLVLNFGSFA